MPAIFSPPLSVQRYCWVHDYLERNTHLTTLTDVGCGNGRMLLWTKTVPHLETINCLDADIDLIDRVMDRYFRPNLHEMLFGRRNSPLPIRINVFQGDVIVPDDRLQADCFTMIEVIEHLTLEHLAEVSRTVFGYYKPKCVIVSTPNREVNHILRQRSDNSELNLPKDPDNQFRHYDHKFEWTRSEFIDWAQSICQQFGYTFSVDGVGELPNCSESLGPCTQIAIFQIKTDNNAGVSIDGDLACFDLLLNKLSVEPKVEFFGDITKKRICLIDGFTVPGQRMEIKTEVHDDFDWSSVGLEEESTQQACDQVMTNAE